MGSLWRTPSWNFGKTYSQRWGKGCKLSLNRSAANAQGLATFAALKKERTCCVWGLSIITWGEKQNKTKQNPKPPSSLRCLCPSNSGRLPALNFIYHLRPYVEILITDIFIFISQTEKACLSSKPFLLKG